MRRLIVLAALAAVTIGCGSSSPTGPTSPPVVIVPPVVVPPPAVPIPAAPRLTPTLPIALSGQSNAVNVEPFLKAVYPLPVYTVAQNSQPIDAWRTDPLPALWTALTPILHQPLQAFVWSQGDSDRTTADYLERMRELFGRVRRENGDPALLIVVVRVLDLPVNASVRAAQNTYVASDSRSVLVSTDGFELGDSDHLTDVGYRTMADRILAALR